MRILVAVIVIAMVISCKNDLGYQKDIEEFNKMKKQLDHHSVDAEIVYSYFGITNVGDDNFFFSQSIHLRFEKARSLVSRRTTLKVYLLDRVYTGFLYQSLGLVIREYHQALDVVNVEIPTNDQLPLKVGQKVKIIF